MIISENKHLFIKGMVWPDRIQYIKNEAQKANLNIIAIKPGKLILENDFTEDQINIFKNQIENNGFSIITEKRDQIVEAIKNEIIEVIHYGKPMNGNKNFSNHLTSVLEKDYSYLSSNFSSSENTTIEKFIILHKIEKTKEYLLEDNFTLKEIAQKLGYSSTQLLSSQFKKTTGMSPSQFIKNNKES